MTFQPISPKQLTQQVYDVTIIGGGMVGATLALGFSQQNKKVLLIEQNLPQNEWLEHPPLRVSAVNRFSEEWLTSIGVWPKIALKDKCQFNRLATWEEGVEPVEFSAIDINESHLGYLARNEAIQLAAFDLISADKNITVLSDVDAVDVSESDIRKELTSVVLSKQKSDANNKSFPNNSSGSSETISNDNDDFAVKTKLVVGADGGNSQVRKLSDIGTTGWDYEQQCFSLTITTDFPQQDITWQQFQPSGPKAFLPLNDGFACLIWYDSTAKVNELKTIDYSQLKEAVLDTFPALPGNFNIVKTASFPLTRRQANNYFKRSLVLVGDAAHTINPLAGQGVNLGFKDNAELLSLLETVDLNDLTSVSRALRMYELKRKADSVVMSGVMDSFYHLFSNEKGLLKFARKTLLRAANALPKAKLAVMKKALGF